MADPAPAAAGFPYEGPQQLREPLAAALSRVVDPEISMNIVDVGLVYGVTVDAAMVHVRITMTSAACPVIELIMDEAETEPAVTVAGAAVAWRIQHGAEGARKAR